MRPACPPSSSRRAPRPALPQRIYRLQHPQLEALDLFLVPVARTPGALHYEAVFG